MRKNRTRHYNLEFKQQAAALAREIGPKRAAEQLGVSVATIQNWKNESLLGGVSEKAARKSKASLAAENKVKHPQWKDGSREKLPRTSAR